jgi:iron complex transport system ATP-binding protein
MRLAAEAIYYAYRPGADVLRDVTLAVGEDRILFVLGANGSGKTTLLDCLSGVRTPRSGSIAIDGIRLNDLSARERARRIGVVPQLHEPVFAYTVAQAVVMGRAPHLGPFAHPGPSDWEAVGRALDAVGVRDLCDRPYTEISGGERQLVLIARGLAQGANCLLMDEPTAHLDPHHQHEVLNVVRQLAGDGFSFVVTSHHPNNALLYADEVVFLVNGGTAVRGPPGRAITEESLRIAYEMEFEIVQGMNGIRAVVPRVKRTTPRGRSTTDLRYGKS